MSTKAVAIFVAFLCVNVIMNWHGVCQAEEPIRFDEIAHGFMSKDMYSLISDIEFNGEYCLISCYSPPQLYRYDGQNLVNLTDSLRGYFSSLGAVKWNGQYWLLAGTSAGPSYAITLVKFDGSTLVLLASGPYTGSLWMTSNALTWNGEYWLIGTRSYLLKWNGSKLEQVPWPCKDSNAHAEVWSMDFNGQYWLIGGDNFQDIPELGRGYPYLLRFDGSSFQVLSQGLRDQPTAIEWNGEYWLIGGSTGKMYKYDGSTLTEIPAPAHVGLILTIAHGADYWAVGGTQRPEASSAFGGRGMLLRYDGTHFVELSNRSASQWAATYPDMVITKLCKYHHGWLIGLWDVQTRVWYLYKAEFDWDLVCEPLTVKLSPGGSVNITIRPRVINGSSLLAPGLISLTYSVPGWFSLDGPQTISPVEAGRAVTISAPSSATPGEYEMNIAGILLGGRKELRLQIIVEKTATSITLALSKSEVGRGETLTLTGSIAPSPGNVQVTIMFSRPDGTTHAATVTTTQDGAFRYDFAPDKTGQWKVLASWAGSVSHEPSISQETQFQVTEPSFPSAYVIGLGILVVVSAGVLVFMKRRKEHKR
jgi:hypothetical protein